MRIISLQEAIDLSHEGDDAASFSPENGLGVEIPLTSGRDRFEMVESIQALRASDKNPSLDLRRLVKTTGLVLLRGLDADNVGQFNHWNHLDPEFRKAFIFWHTHINSLTALMSGQYATPETYFGETRTVLADILNVGRCIRAVTEKYAVDLGIIERFLQSHEGPITVRDVLRSKVIRALSNIEDCIAARLQWERAAQSMKERSSQVTAVTWEPGMACFASSDSTLHMSCSDRDASGVLLQQAI